MRRLLTAALGLMLLALAGCSGDADPAPAPARPSSTTASPSPSPSPTAPAMPDAARAHTEAGAKAFVEYFWEVADFASESLDAAPLLALTADRCVGCERVVDLINELQRKHGRMSGSVTTLGHLRVNALSIAGQPRTEVVFDVTTPQQVLDFPGTKDDETYPPTTSKAHLYLKAMPDGWRVVLWESV